MGLHCVNSLQICKTTCPLYSFEVRDGMELGIQDGGVCPNRACHIVSYFCLMELRAEHWSAATVIFTCSSFNWPIPSPKFLVLLQHIMYMMTTSSYLGWFSCVMYI